MVELLFSTDEHRLLHDTVTRFFADPQQLERILADTGLLALPFACADGGLSEDGSDDLTDLAITFAAKGMAYGLDTLLFQAVLGGGLIARTSSPDRDAILRSIIEGRQRIAVGLLEPRGRADVFYCETRATRMDHGWTIDGIKTLVLGAEGASRLIVLARIEPCSDDPKAGLGLFQFDAKSGNIELRHYRLRDGTPASDVTLKGVALPDQSLIAGPDFVVDVLERTLAVTRLCLAAEASGLMHSILSGTAKYVNQRQQFGQAIGAFQVIQHRLADLAVMADQSAALVSRISKNSAAVVDINTAYHAVAEMGMTAAKTAIQLHGGYGMTEDLPYGHALRRMMTIALLFRVPVGT